MSCYFLRPKKIAAPAAKQPAFRFLTTTNVATSVNPTNYFYLLFAKQFYKFAHMPRICGGEGAGGDRDAPSYKATAENLPLNKFIPFGKNLADMPSQIIQKTLSA
jgi:hypothetical protein